MVARRQPASRSSSLAASPAAARLFSAPLARTGATRRRPRAGFSLPAAEEMDGLHGVAGGLGAERGAPRAAARPRCGLAALRRVRTAAKPARTVRTPAAWQRALRWLRRAAIAAGDGPRAADGGAVRRARLALRAVGRADRQLGLRGVSRGRARDRPAPPLGVRRDLLPRSAAGALAEPAGGSGPDRRRRWRAGGRRPVLFAVLARAAAV